MKSSFRNNNMQLCAAIIGLSPPQTKHVLATNLIMVAVLWLMPLTADFHAAPSLNRNPGWPGNTLSEVECYGEARGFGPFDYVNEKSKLGVVEEYHFTPQIEQLTREGKRSHDSNLDYTLRAFPNHHRALWALSRHYLRKAQKIGFDELARLERARKRIPPPECYFQRAKRFAPHDEMVSAIFGIYLHRRGELDAALAEYRIAEAKDPRNAELIYNMGLLFLDMNELPLAKQYAERAASLGYPLTGLQKKVKDHETERPGSSP